MTSPRPTSTSTDSPGGCPTDAPVDARALSKLRWRCRRGLLENDLIIERFFTRHAAQLTERQAAGIATLMDLPDNDLLDLFLARREPAGGLEQDDDVAQVLRLLRAPGPTAREGNRHLAMKEST